MIFIYLQCQYRHLLLVEVFGAGPLSSCPIFNQTCMGDASGPIYGVNRLMLNLGYEFQM